MLAPSTHVEMKDSKHSSFAPGLRRSLARIFHQINHRSWFLVSLLLAIHAGLLAHSATWHSPTLNEPGHLVAGLSNWKFGRFELYRVNPPLVRMVAALPVMVVGYEEDWTGFYESPGARPVFGMGADFIKANGERSLWLFTIARWACIPFSLIGGLFCFLWARDLWNSERAGLLALALWCFEPNILAHGELITSDCAATSLGLGAGYLFWKWLKTPAWNRAIYAGLLLGLAQLAKMSLVILFGLWPLLWLFWVLLDSRSTREQELPPSQSVTIQKQLSQLSAILCIGLYLLNFGYCFDGSFTQLKEFTFVSSAFTGLEESGAEGNRFQETFLAEVPVPLPKQYLLGMDIQKHDFEDYGQPSYLRGEWKDGGWWYYYLYAFAVKTTHGWQLLLLCAIVTLLYWRPVTVRDLVALLLPAIVIFVLVSSQLEFNHHFRYVLPAFGPLLVLSGVNALWFEKQKPGRSKEPAAIKES